MGDWGLRDVFGSKPQLPPWHGLDLSTEQGKAIAGNIANLPEASRLANLTEQQILSMMGQAIPGFEGMRTQISSNISDELSGKLPKDVQDAIQNSAAAKALGGGFGGSGMHGDLVARDLGLTSLNLMDRGLSAAESWMASTERLLSPAVAEFTNMFVSAGQQAAFDVNERNMKFEHDWLGAQIAAMPDPVARGIFDTNYAVGMSVLNIYGGHADTTGGQRAGTAGQNVQWGGGGGGGSGGPGTGGTYDDAIGWESANPSDDWWGGGGGGAGADYSSGSGVSSGMDFNMGSMGGMAGFA